MTVRNKFYFLFLALAVLTACTTSSSDEDTALDGEESVADELSQEELGNDAVADTEAELNDAETTDETEVADAGTEGSVDPDLAEDVFNDEAASTETAQATPPPEQAPELSLDAQTELNAEEPPPAAEPTQVAEANQVDITNIRYLGEQGGQVVIDTSAPATYRTREVPNQNQMVIEIANARLPAKLKRPFITKDFKQPIASINAYQDTGSTTARLIVQFREPTTADVSQDGGRLVLSASGTSSAVADNSGGDDSQDSGTSNAVNNPDEQRFYGKPINIEVRETNIRDVLSLIAEQSGANIVISDEVKGNVTIKLRQIPWDQALAIIMKTKNLGYVRQGSVLRIAPVDQLQKETDDLRKIQDTQKLALPLRVKVVPVSYAKVGDLATQVKDFLSTRGKIVADVRTSSLIITDISENLDRATNLIKALDTPPQQVLIEGKVVEAASSLSRSLGINWGLSGETQYQRGASISPQLNIAPGGVAANGLAFSVTAGTMKYIGDLSATIGLAESKSQAKVLSSPRIVTLNNEQATIKQVTQIPISQESTTNNTISKTVTYKPVELSLDVTPQITAKTDILLQISLKREFNTDAANPVIESREAKTKIMVPSGQTAVIGGIYQNDQSHADKGVPVLQDVPVVGWLFKTREASNTKRELLLFLTPRILSKSKTIDTQ